MLQRFNVKKILKTVLIINNTNEIYICLKNFLIENNLGELIRAGINIS